MARIKLTLPERFSFLTTVSVRIGDVNYGNHLGNDAVLSLVHEARMQYLNSLGLTELDFGGVGLIMADAAIEFKAEAFYGDVLTIAVAAAGFSRAGFDLYYKLTKGDAVIALAKTGMICFDYKARRVSSVPESARNKFN